VSASDAIPVPRKNTAFRFYFAIRKPSDSTLITSWTGADSEVSLDGAAFGDCTNEATEIGTSGCGYIDLTSSEMNADSVILKITVTNSGAVPLVFSFCPESAGDYRIDTTTIDAILVDTAEIGAAGAGLTNINLPDQTMNIMGDITGNLSGSVGSVTGAVGSVTGSVGSVTGLTASNLDVASSTLATAANLATLAGYVDTEVAAIKTKTDQLTFTVANQVDANALTGGGGMDAAATRAALGLASANLDTQLGAIDDYLDTELAAVKAKTDQMVFTVANQIDANALTGGGSGLDAAQTRAALGLASANLDTQLGAIDDFLDTEVAAIKAKTDNLPSDPADQSAVEAAITAATSPLATQLSVNDLPTNAELATALGTSDDATLAAIAALNNISTAQVNAEVDTALADVGLTATITGRIDAAISTRLSTAGYTAPDNASIVAAAADAAELNDTKLTTARAAVLDDWMNGGRLDLLLDAIPTTIRMKKNTALAGWQIVIFGTSGDPATGKTVSGVVSKDGGAFGSLTNAVSEVSLGAYTVDLAAGDTNGNNLLFAFTATGCKTLFVKVVTQP